MSQYSCDFIIIIFTLEEANLNENRHTFLLPCQILFPALRTAGMDCKAGAQTARKTNVSGFNFYSACMCSA